MLNLYFYRVHVFFLSRIDPKISKWTRSNLTLLWTSADLTLRFFLLTQTSFKFKIWKECKKIVNAWIDKISEKNLWILRKNTGLTWLYRDIQVSKIIQNFIFSAAENHYLLKLKNTFWIPPIFTHVCRILDICFLVMVNKMWLKTFKCWDSFCFFLSVSECRWAWGWVILKWIPIPFSFAVVTLCS